MTDCIHWYYPDTLRNRAQKKASKLARDRRYRANNREAIKLRRVLGKP